MNTDKFLSDIKELQDNLNKLATQANQASSELDNKIKVQQNDLDNLIRTQRAFNTNADNSTVYFQNTLSTTQFFDGSLAKDTFNQAGNTVPWYYKTYARKVRGLNMQGAAAYQQSGNVLNTSNNQQNLNPQNGSGVGWGTPGATKLDSVLAQKWWAWWVVQLATIQKLTGLVSFETEDKLLLIQLYRAYQLAIIAGHSLIRKVGEKYAVYFAYCVEYDEFNTAIKCKRSSASWFFNNGSIPNDDEDEDIELTNNDEYVLLTWDINHYNVWFYTVFYTIDYIDLLYIWLNRTFISRAIIFQEVGSSGASKTEALELMNPLNTVIQIRTSGLEAAEASMVNSSRTNELEIANKYKYLQLGDSQSDAVFSSFPKIWMNIWDSILGIIPPNNKLDASRSISDEVEPNMDINQILQKKYGLTLDLFVDEVKEKWSVDVSYTLLYEAAEKDKELDNNAAYKNEGGNQSEQQSINTLSDDK